MSFLFASHNLVRSSEHRFTHVTPDDHSATIWIVSVLSLIYTVLTLAVRLGYTKWRTHALDDIVVTLAHLAGFGVWAFLFKSLRNGLGKSFSVLSNIEISQVQQSFFKSRILSYAALTLSKCSILILIRAVFTRNIHVSRMSIGGLLIVVIWGVFSISAISLHCPAEHVIPERGQDHCVDFAVAVGDIVTEILITSLPILGLYNTQLPLKSKATVMLAFSTRIPNIAISISYLIASFTFITKSHPAIAIIAIVTWQIVLLSYNLMSAATPLLRGFTQGFKTAGMSLFDMPNASSAAASGATQDSVELRLVPRPKMLPQDLAMSINRTVVLGGDGKRRSRACRGGDGYYDDVASMDSCGSRWIMVRREWEVSDEQ
ncbi:hypothetical protein COCSADRAFT_192306 [Bipolaris sorokiniana ND90Pr]|uniref:Rhodopsin domain-containing protein n=1 Tax=Cochliobolus sativus (strain ND90Pr / ATCC 201652) TaxID=665912 RepID=M2S2A6_COCSN|nr:uncharacterized protein COCSADRAFT_192306 [Bipolaris sorokiniana ND90Pr]EMD61338.1 hypothetical protein COCSADRAFT_192306 [Bipolaris sorokiniana ND90Pr]